MLKKIFSAFLFILLTSTYVSAQLPYEKMIGLSNDELKEKKFKYDSKKNLYTLSKKNKTNQTLNVLNSISGNTADSRPHEEDYTMYVQKGANDETAYMSIVFYSDETYHKLLTWMAENNIEPISTSSGKLSMQKASYGDYNIEIITEVVPIITTTKNTAANSKSFDESFNVYTYTIYTGVAPESQWHTKEAEKKAKKKLKGDKEDLDDMM